ncbi:MAG: hypothetical protein IPK16_01455 [Anaerolineales bacterium]|nr:hypothetical protein [Anaerolineales bacterium]
MLVAPRRSEGALGISVNSLGFAGSLLVRNRTQLTLLDRYGPHTLLCSVTGAAPPNR